jgi:exportin-T
MSQQATPGLADCEQAVLACYASAPARNDNDPSHSKALQFLQSIKQGAQSWRLHYQLFRQSQIEVVKFYALQTLQGTLRTSYTPVQPSAVQPPPPFFDRAHPPSTHLFVLFDSTDAHAPSERAGGTSNRHVFVVEFGQLQGRIRGKPPIDWSLRVQLQGICGCSAVVLARYFPPLSLSLLSLPVFLSPSLLYILLGFVGMGLIVLPFFLRYPKAQPSYVKTKLAVVVVCMLKADFPEAWPNAFGDLLQLTTKGVHMVDLYLRILKVLNEEIVAFSAQRSEVENTRNMVIKDAMRANQAVNSIFDCIRNILTEVEGSISQHAAAMEIAVGCLEVLASFIGWVDLKLILNDAYLSLLFRLMGTHGIRCGAVQCVQEIVMKGMPVAEKINIIRGMSILDFLQQLERQVQQAGANDDDDFCESLATLFNVIFVQLLQCEDGDLKGDGNVKILQDFKMLVSGLVEKGLSSLLSFLAHSDSDVAECVFGSLEAFVSMLRRQQQSTNDSAYFQAKTFLPQLLPVLLQQFRYPLDHEFYTQDEDDAEVDVFRKEVRKYFVNLVRLEPLPSLQFLGHVMSSLISSHEGRGLVAVPFNDVEATLSLFYHYSEGCNIVTATTAKPSKKGTRGGVVGNEVQIVTMFHSMLFSVHKSFHEALRLTPENGAPPFPHKSVVLVYVEICVRYAKILTLGVDGIDGKIFVPLVLDLVCTNLCSNPSGHVRSRCAYLLLRFCKALSGAILGPHVFKLLEGINGLLQMDVREPNNEGSQKNLLSSEDQFLLFEIAGFLIAESVQPDNKRQMLEIVTKPLVDKLHEGTNVLKASGVQQTQVAYVVSVLCRIIACIAHVGKSFKFFNALNVQNKKVSKDVTSHTSDSVRQEVGTVFTWAMEATVSILQLLPNNVLLRSQSTFFFHQMITCLGDLMLPFLPPTIEILVNNAANVEDARETVQLINKLVACFQQAMCPLVQAAIYPTLMMVGGLLSSEADQFSAEKSALAEATPMTGEENENLELRKLWYSFFQAVLIHMKSHAARVLGCKNNETNLEPILESVLYGCKAPLRISNEDIKKQCFGILRNVLACWDFETAGEDIITRAAHGRLWNFYTYKVTQSSFECPMMPRFDMADASGMLLLSEIAHLHILLLQRLGNALVDMRSQNMSLPFSIPGEVGEVKFLTFFAHLCMHYFSCAEDIAGQYVQILFSGNEPQSKDALRTLVGARRQQS